MRRRDPLPGLVLLLLTVLGALVYLTRAPEHPIWDRLAGLPALGPAVERLREGYRPPVRPPPAPPEIEWIRLETGPSGEAVATVIGAESAPRVPPAVDVWVLAGTELRAAPDPASAVVETVPAIGTMQLREERGGWSRLARVRLGGRVFEGWVRSAALRRPTREELWQPAPVLPLPAASPSAELLAAARDLLGDGARELPCGPFRLLTDDRGPVVESCPRLAGQLDALYRARTGLEPAGDAAETILLFASSGAYLIFRTRFSPASRGDAFAAPGRGFVALASGGRALERVQAMLVHELVHLLNRRFLGPALPPWIDEGLAEEFGMSRIAADGTLAPGSLGSFEGGSETLRVVGGGETRLAALRAGLRRDALPPLAELAGLDRQSFRAAPKIDLHYSLSAFWVRYLLSPEAPAGGEGFRSFLAAVAAGERLEDDLLIERLGADWDEVEGGFRRWLEAGASGG